MLIESGLTCVDGFGDATRSSATCLQGALVQAPFGTEQVPPLLAPLETHADVLATRQRVTRHARF